MKTVGAGLGYRIHDRATEFSVFGIKAIGDEPEFFDGIQVRNQSSAQVAAFADVRPIYQKCVGSFTLAIYGDIA